MIFQFKKKRDRGMRSNKQKKKINENNQQPVCLIVDFTNDLQNRNCAIVSRAMMLAIETFNYVLIHKILLNF